MTLLTICIPVFGRPETVIAAVRQMLRSTRRDFEILVSDFSGEPNLLGLFAADQADPRFSIVAPEPESGDPASPWQKSLCWNRMIPHAQGEWISIIGETDYADPEICAVIEATLKRVPQADALSWARAAYTWPEARQGPEIARIGTGSRLLLPEQKDLMQKLFYWADATDRPDCFFGAWHGAVRRSLLERIREAFSGVYFEQAAPEIDSLCKTVLMAGSMVFWERPMSVQGAFSATGNTAPADAGVRLEGFPFSSDTGVAAGIALTIEAFKQRYGIELNDWEDNFIQACAHDCERAASGDRFHARKALYTKAITEWRGKRALARFKPEFKRNPKLPRFQGIRDQHLHFDMAMDDTRTAAEFYGLIDAMLFPVALLDDKLA